MKSLIFLVPQNLQLRLSDMPEPFYYLLASIEPLKVAGRGPYARRGMKNYKYHTELMMNLIQKDKHYKIPKRAIRNAMRKANEIGPRTHKGYPDMVKRLQHMEQKTGKELME